MDTKRLMAKSDIRMIVDMHKLLRHLHEPWQLNIAV